MSQGGGIVPDGQSGPPPGFRTTVMFIGGTVFMRMTGSCDLYRIRGFIMVDGKPDLSSEVYTGPWGSADAVQEEFERLWAGQPTPRIAG